MGDLQLRCIYLKERKENRGGGAGGRTAWRASQILELSSTVPDPLPAPHPRRELSVVKSRVQGHTRPAPDAAAPRPSLPLPEARAEGVGGVPTAKPHWPQASQLLQTSPWSVPPRTAPRQRCQRLTLRLPARCQVPDDPGH